MTTDDPCPTCAAVPNEETDELYARIAMLESDLAVARAELAETQQSHCYALDEIAKLRASLEAVTDALQEVQRLTVERDAARADAKRYYDNAYKLEERILSLRAALERIADMAVRPHCLCGLPTGTGAIEACARRALSPGDET